jgi:hypothetical protein
MPKRSNPRRVRRGIQEHGDSFPGPVGLVPEGMRDVQVTDTAKGNVYCLTFRKPCAAPRPGGRVQETVP